MFDAFEEVASDLYNKLATIPNNYEYALEEQVKAFIHMQELLSIHEQLRSGVAIGVSQEGEKAGKKYSLDRIEQGVNIDPVVVESQKRLLQAKRVYEEKSAQVKIIENRQKICHDLVSLIGSISRRESEKRGCLPNTI